MIVPLLSRLATIAIMLVGLAMAAVGILLTISGIGFESHARKMDAEVIRSLRREAKGGTRSEVTYGYRDASGHRWEGTDQVRFRTMSPGDRISIRYDFREPMESIADESWPRWIGPIFISAVGVVIGLSPLRKKPPNKTPQPTTTAVMSRAYKGRTE